MEFGLIVDYSPMGAEGEWIYVVFWRNSCLAEGFKELPDAMFCWVPEANSDCDQTGILLVDKRFMVAGGISHMGGSTVGEDAHE